MKILKLKFRNINSLAGDWKIDFTQPEFTENGSKILPNSEVKHRQIRK